MFEDAVHEGSLRVVCDNFQLLWLTVSAPYSRMIITGNAYHVSIAGRRSVGLL